MILLYMRSCRLRTELGTLIQQLHEKVAIYDAADKDGMSALYDRSVSAVVSDASAGGLPEAAWLDLMSALGRRIPVIVVEDNQGKSVEDAANRSSVVSHNSSSELYRADTFIRAIKSSAKEILQLLEVHGAIRKNSVSNKKRITVYSHQIPGKMIQENGCLNLLLIDASPLRHVRLEFGSEIYYRVQECFEETLLQLWGSAGNFRTADILCRRSPSSNTFYIFLERARSGSGMPVPGALERLADRLVGQLQNALWSELFANRGKRVIPSGMSALPDFSIGHASGIVNPCIDPIEFTESLIEAAAESSRLQMSRLMTTRREFLLSVMHAPELLHPNYQAVFHLGALTHDQIKESHSRKDIRPMQHLLYGFESLIRVRRDWVGIVLSSEERPFLDARYLTPDVLFSLAQTSDVAVELDQACLRQATMHSRSLPGHLFLNIFPRNLYHVERLGHLLARQDKLIFEVAESEAINNIDLMNRVRSYLQRVHIKIAVDDVGKGYAGLERIIRIQPDLVKFDRSLIENIHQEKPKQAFVKGLLEAAKISGAIVLAEGVELWEEAKVLQDFGVDLIQGYLTHRPQSLEDLLKATDRRYGDDQEDESASEVKKAS